MKLILHLTYCTAMISPLPIIVAVCVGVWAWRSRRAPVFGALSIAVAVVTGVTAVAILAWYIIQPLPVADPNINAFVPWITLCKVVGPMAVVTTMLIPITLILTLRNRRPKANNELESIVA
jgi:hypothetical protein